MEETATSTLKLWIVLARAYAAVQKHARAHVATHDLTLAEFGVLEALHHKGPMLLNEVQRKILVSSGGVTYLVDRLAAKGLVGRRPCDDDRRAIWAELTDAGAALIERIFPEHARQLERALAALDEDEKVEVTRLLKKLGLAAAELDPTPT